jgi:hypothetical protein
VTAHGLKRGWRHFDGEVEVAEATSVDDCTFTVSPGQERPHVRKRLLRRRQADALQRPLRQRLEPLERQGEVRAPFVPDEGMDLVDDHGAHRPQGLSTARRCQE